MIDYVLDWKPRRSVKHCYIWARYGKYEGMLRKLICRRICTCKQFFFSILNNVKELENVKQIVFSVSLRQHSGEQTKAAFIRACLWWRVLYGPYKWALEGVLGWGSINGYLMLECGTDSASVHLCWSHESYTHAGFTISWFADRLQKIWS